MKRAAALVARLAPEPLRSSLLDDGLATADAVVASQLTRVGRLRSGLSELLNLFIAVVLARVRRSAISAGRAPGGQRPRGKGVLDSMLTDLKTAWRSLNASRATVLIAVLTLALGIGVNTAVFSVLDSVLLRPVPYPEAHRLATLWQLDLAQGFSSRGGFDRNLMAEWQRQTDLFDRVEAAETRSFVFASPNGAVMLDGARVTPGLMSMLGASPMAGRLFGDGDGQPGTDRTVIVSERFWSKHLGRDPEAVGRDLELDGSRFQLVGVLSDFRYPDEFQDIWVPVDPAALPADAGTPALRLTPLVRFQPGLDFETAGERATARGEALSDAAGGRPGQSVKLQPLGRFYQDRVEASLLALGVAVVFLLLIVCANVASLTLSRALARVRDSAVRSALGASRGRLVREALVEYSLVAVAGAVTGLLISQALMEVTVGLLPEAITRSSLNAIDLDTRALVFLCVTAASTVLLFGVPPALLATRASVTDSLRSSSRSSTGTSGARRLRAAMAVAEVSLSIVLLVGAALMARSMMKLSAIETGIDAENLIATRLALPAPQYASPAVQDQFVSTVLARLRQNPGVEAAAAGRLPTEMSMVAMGPVSFGDRADPLPGDQFFPVSDVWPGFFAAAGIDMVDGRDFVPDDVEGATVVSEELASRFWPGGSAVGARFRIGDAPWRTVVGVVSDVRVPREDPVPGNGQIYYPWDQVSGVFRGVGPGSTIAEYRTVIVRATRPGELSAQLADEIHLVDPQVVVERPRAVARHFADAIARPRVVFFMMATFAGFGLVLAVAGLFGVLSHLVTQRRREIGIRFALGATRRDIGRVVFGSGMALTGIGIVVGIAAALGLTQLMQSLLYEVDPFDPTAFVAVVALILTAAALATWQPARRAMRVNPVALLRED